MPPIMLQQLMLQQQMSQQRGMQQPPQMPQDMFRMPQQQPRFIGSENDDNVHIQKLLNQSKFDF